MRSGIFLQSLPLTLLLTVSAGAQSPDSAPAREPAPLGAPPPPPAGYPPPPPGYPPAGYGDPGAPVERSAQNSVYIEGLGPGLFYSLNYDRTFGDFAGRVGFSYISVGASTNSSEGHASLTTIPLTLSYIGIGSKKNIFELGAGATIVHAGAGFSSLGADSQSSSTTFLLGDLIFGYRLQPPDGGFMLRTGLSPIYGHGIFIPWPYLALGGTF